MLVPAYNDYTIIYLKAKKRVFTSTKRLGDLSLRRIPVVQRKAEACFGVRTKTLEPKVGKTKSCEPLKNKLGIFLGWTWVGDGDRITG